MSTCHLTGVRDSAGKGLTSPVGDGRPLVPLDTAGMVPLSPVVDGCLPVPLDTADMVPLSLVVDGCLPCRPSVLLSGHHEEKYHHLAT